MKKQVYIYIILGFITISCKSFKNPYVEKQNYQQFEYTKLGYDYMTLIVYSDSTYYYDRWTHNQVTNKDYGTWKVKDDYMIFNSVESYTAIRNKKHKTNKKYFINQKMRIINDTLQLYSNKEFENDKVIKKLIKVK